MQKTFQKTILSMENLENLFPEPDRENHCYGRSYWGTTTPCHASILSFLCFPNSKTRLSDKVFFADIDQRCSTAERNAGQDDDGFLNIQINEHCFRAKIFIKKLI